MIYLAKYRAICSEENFPSFSYKGYNIIANRKMRGVVFQFPNDISFCGPKRGRVFG